MSLIVHKYGGTSVADAQRIKHVARKIARAREQGHQVVVVVSAMGDSTDQLAELAHEVAPEPEERAPEIARALEKAAAGAGVGGRSLITRPSLRGAEERPWKEE